MKTEAHIWSAPRTSRWSFRTRGMAAWVAACAAIVCAIALPAAHAQQGGGTVQAKGNSSVPPVVLSPPPDVAAPSAYTAEKSASGVFMKVLTPRNGVEHPAENDCLRVRFTKWNSDGSLFSSSGIYVEFRVKCIKSAIPGTALDMTPIIPVTHTLHRVP